MVAKGELFELEVLGQMWLPAVFLEVPREAVAEVNRALTRAGVDAADAFVLWHRRHGSLGGRDLVQALSMGIDAAQVMGPSLPNFEPANPKSAGMERSKRR